MTDLPQAIAELKRTTDAAHPFVASHFSDCSILSGQEQETAIDALPARGVGVPQIVVDQLNVTVGEVGLEMVQDAEDAEFTGERPDLHDYQVSIPYDHAVAILAALARAEAQIGEQGRLVRDLTKRARDAEEQRDQNRDTAIEFETALAAERAKVAKLVEAARDAEYDLLQWLECGEHLTKAGFNMDGTPEVVRNLTAALREFQGKSNAEV